ncbi:hypothetical protein M9458_023435, partial [Cirrhinus mrigala]
SLLCQNPPLHQRKPMTEKNQKAEVRKGKEWKRARRMTPLLSIQSHRPNKHSRPISLVSSQPIRHL